ncbi:hypothetical protein N7470_009209 [Penicillium chermesinum]|nr:hypothetical protein N7470_009209 [Penicillium chermesinum]
MDSSSEPAASSGRPRIPPGAKDPYTGESQLMHQPEPEANEKEDSSADFGDEGTLAKGYEQAETWHGLKRIGFAPEKAWIYHGPSEADKYQRYNGKASRVRQDTPSAAHQVAVEICLLQLCGKPLDAVHTLLYNKEKNILAEQCIVEGSETSTLWFPNEEVKTQLVALFEKVGAGKNATPTQGEKPDTVSLSLIDPEVKFHFAKRFSVLTHRRVPDKAISSSSSVAQFVAAMTTKMKEKPPNVIRKFARRKNAGVLPPNIQFSGKRINKNTEDEAYGRKKIIHAELYNRGLVLPKRGSRMA